MAKYRTYIIWFAVIIILVMAFSNFGPRRGVATPVSYSDFVIKVESGQITSVLIQGQDIHAIDSNDRSISTYLPMSDRYLLGELIKKKVNVVGRPPEEKGVLTHIILSWLPLLILVGIYIYFMRIRASNALKNICIRTKNICMHIRDASIALENAFIRDIRVK